MTASRDVEVLPARVAEQIVLGATTKKKLQQLISWLVRNGEESAAGNLRHRG